MRKIDSNIFEIRCFKKRYTETTAICMLILICSFNLLQALQNIISLLIKRVAQNGLK